MATAFSDVEIVDLALSGDGRVLYVAAGNHSVARFVVSDSGQLHEEGTTRLQLTRERWDDELHRWETIVTAACVQIHAIVTDSAGDRLVVNARWEPREGQEKNHLQERLTAWDWSPTESTLTTGADLQDLLDECPIGGAGQIELSAPQSLDASDLQWTVYLMHEDVNTPELNGVRYARC